jgi:transcriptional regulator with XRE-family HTH domain
MDFPERLATLRKARGLTQAQLADAVELHVAQIGRYENGTSQPTLDAIRRLATTLNVTADLLVFDTDERGPDDDLRLAFEATRQLDDDERRTVRDVIEAILLKHDARRWTNAS